jgi:hypothetical protein
MISSEAEVADVFGTPIQYGTGNERRRQLFFATKILSFLIEANLI